MLGNNNSRRQGRRRFIGSLGAAAAGLATDGPPARPTRSRNSAPGGARRFAHAPATSVVFHHLPAFAEPSPASLPRCSTRWVAGCARRGLSAGPAP